MLNIKIVVILMKNNEILENKILIVGGYGSVGSVVSQSLSKQFLDKLIIAGPNFNRAKKHANQLGSNVIPLAFDVNDKAQFDETLYRVSLVIMCIDQSNTKFVEACLLRGIHYVDISASYKFLSQVELLSQLAIENKSSVVLSVGLAPGVTNLLSSLCKIKDPTVEQIDIFIMLGSGERHGNAAYKWAFNDLNDKYLISNGESDILVSTFEDGKETEIFGLDDSRVFYPSNFSDQHVLPRTLGIESVNTRLCFDSKALTLLFVAMKKIGLHRLLVFQLIQRFLIKVMSIVRIGDENFLIKVSAKSNDPKNSNPEYILTGSNEASITGQVTAKVAHELLRGSVGHGIFHIEQAFEPSKFINNLDVVVYEK